jgi:3-deoxy-manno-octulosonate cytidylyltransferase (CMP-KDO synthetase)
MDEGNQAKLNPIVVIPARMASMRLPGKPLADIGGVPMIVRVMRCAQEANIGPVVVACAENEIADAVRAAGGEAVLTAADLPSGSDRVRAAIDKIDPKRTYNCVVNLQGDLPTLDPDVLRTVVDILAARPQSDISTLCVASEDAREIADPNVVKAIVSFDTKTSGQAARPVFGRALYFTRAAAPTGAGPIWHHIGIYAYRRRALERFCDLPPSPLERREKLEQLRALEAGMEIAVGCVDAAPHGVDTPDDLERARTILSGDIYDT